MTKLTIESTPSGGIISIDGIDMGVTPATISLGDDITLLEFRDEYMDGDSVKCTWPTMETLLVNLVVSKLWWLFSRNERYSIAEMAIKNTFPYNIRRGREGLFGCAGGVGELKTVMCVGNTIIRVLKFGRIDYMGGQCYHRRYSDSTEYCYRVENIYGLPCHTVGCGSYEPGFGHSMAAIQIVDSYDSIDNWMVFQYGDVDIKPGSYQMPTDDWDLYLKFGELTHASCAGFSSDTLARFEHI